MLVGRVSSLYVHGSCYITCMYSYVFTCHNISMPSGVLSDLQPPETIKLSNVKKPAILSQARATKKSRTSHKDPQSHPKPLAFPAVTQRPRPFPAVTPKAAPSLRQPPIPPDLLPEKSTIFGAFPRLSVFPTAVGGICAFADEACLCRESSTFGACCKLSSCSG